MIRNKTEYSVTEKKLAAFREAIDKLKKKNDISPVLKEIQLAAVMAQAEILAGELEEYEYVRDQGRIVTKTK